MVENKVKNRITVFIIYLGRVRYFAQEICETSLEELTGTGKGDMVCRGMHTADAFPKPFKESQRIFKRALEKGRLWWDRKKGHLKDQ